MAKTMNTDSGMGSLITLGGNLENPREAKPSDFPAVIPGSAGEASGAGKLTVLTENQEGPRHTDDDGSQSASVWGKLGGFAVGKAKPAGTAVKYDCSVDFESGEYK